MSQTKTQLVGGVGLSTADSLTVHNGLAVTGVVTASSFSGNGDSLTFTNISAADGSFSGNVSIGGTLTYEDVTNVDSVGLITARTGLNIVGGGMTVTGISTFINGLNIVGGGMTVTGISTFTDNTIFESNVNLGDNDKLRFGGSNDLEIHHSTTGNVNYIDVSQPLYFRSSHGSGTQFYFQAPSGENSLIINHNGSVDLYFDNNKKFETTTDGISVTGTISDSKGDVRSIPQNSNSSQTTLVATDNGKVVMTSSGGWVIPASVMSQGNTVTLLNGSGSNQTVNATALTTLYNTADGANIKSNTITLGASSMATIWFSSGTVGYIQASNITVS